MPVDKVKEQTHWQFVRRGAAPYPLWTMAVTVPPSPLPNPLQIQVTVTGCADPTIVAYLTDADGDSTYGTVSAPPSPYTVTFPEVPSGDYTLTVQVQCGSDVKNQSQNISLP